MGCWKSFKINYLEPVIFIIYKIATLYKKP